MSRFVDENVRRDVGEARVLLIYLSLKARLLRSTCFCARNNLRNMGGHCYGEGFLIYVWEGCVCLCEYSWQLWMGCSFKGNPTLPISVPSFYETGLFAVQGVIIGVHHTRSCLATGMHEPWFARIVCTSDVSAPSPKRFRHLFHTFQGSVMSATFGQL
jgi:hypothetical protein